MRRAAVALIVGIALGFAAGHATATSPSGPDPLPTFAPVVLPSRTKAPQRSGDVSSLDQGRTGDAAGSGALIPCQPEDLGSTPSACGASPLPAATEAPSLPPPTNVPEANVSPAATPESEVPPTPGPTRQPTRSLSGVASWYCRPGVSVCTKGYAASGMYAAAGPALRVGNWRGRYVTVNGIRVQLIDWCQCYGSRIIDLYASAFRKVVDPTWYPGKKNAKGELIPDPLSRGTYTVRVTW